MVTDPFERRQRRVSLNRLGAQRSRRLEPKKDFTTEATARRNCNPSRAMAVPATLQHGREARGTKSSRVTKNLGISNCSDRRVKNYLVSLRGATLKAGNKGEFNASAAETSAIRAYEASLPLQSFDSCGNDYSVSS